LLPTSLFILPDGHADRCPGRRKLTLSYWVGSLDRPPTDVHACNSIRVCFEVAFDAPEVSPVPAVVSRDMAASRTGLTCIFGGNLNKRYSQHLGFVGERMAEEAVGYSIGFPSALATELASSPPQSVEVLNSDSRIVFSSQIGQPFSQQPSVCSNIVSLSSTQSPQLDSSFASVTFPISVFLQFGASIFVADLSQRNVSSKVELLQNPALSTHHSYSNAVAVLVDSENILGFSWGWEFLLKNSEETVATGHQNACCNPTICQMFLESSVCAILLYRQTKPFMANSYAEDWMFSACAFEAEKPFVETHCWLIDCRCNFSPLPSVSLCFFNQLACCAVRPVLRVGEMVELRVGLRILGLDGLKTFGGNCLESRVRFMELSLLNTSRRQKVKLKRLLRRYRPKRKTLSKLFNWERYAKAFRNSSPCLKAGVSLR